MDMKELLDQVIQSRSPSNFSFYESIIEPKRTMHFLVIGGTHYDKGYFYGLHLAKIMHPLLKRILSYAGKAGLGVSGEKIDEEKFYFKVPEVFKHAGSHRLAELKGFLDGCKDAGVPFTDERGAGLAVAFFELNEAACCSSCAINSPVSTSDTYQINVSEFPFPIGAQNNSLIMLYFPQNEQGQRQDQAHFGLGFAGLLSGITGINEKGLTFGSIRSSFIRAPYNPLGVPFHYLMQDALQVSSNVKEMREYIQKQPRTNGYYATVSDPSATDDSLNLWILGPNLFHAYKPNEEIDQSILQNPKYTKYIPMEHCVYWMDMPVPGIEAGPDRAYAILQREKPFDDKKAIQLTKDLGSKFAVLSTVYNTTKMYGWVAFAKRKIPSQDDKYHYLDYKKFFASYEDFLNERHSSRFSRSLFNF